MAVGIVAVGILLFYVNRIFAELPLYASDEGAYFIRALFTPELTARPDLHPTLQPVGNTVFLLLIRALDFLSLNVLQWLRVIGACAYFGGLVLVANLGLRDATRAHAVGILAIALTYPYYRFVFSAMPEGLYVGILCVIIYATGTLYRRHPLAHVALVGVFAGVLILIKPHGLMILPAMAALIVTDAVISRSNALLASGRIVMFGVTFALTVICIQQAAGTPGDPFAFLQGGVPRGPSSENMAAVGRYVAAVSALSVGSVLAVFAALPAVAGVAHIIDRCRTEDHNDRALAGTDLAFLLVLGAIAATAVMVVIFAVQISFMATETNRLWGRYFEFLVPLLWLTAAPAIVDWEAKASMASRSVVCGLMLAGVGGLFLCFAKGLTIFPWDGAAVTAFASAPDFPYRWLALFATLGAIAATFLRQPARRVAPVYFVLLGLLSTRFDDRFGGDISAQRAVLEHELHVAYALVGDTAGPVAIVAHDHNASHIAFMRFKARAFIKLSPPGVIEEPALLPYARVVVIGPENLRGRWRETFAGQQVSVFTSDEARR